MTPTEFPGGRAVLTVDLGALAANWRALRDRAGAAEVAAVVKADGYGLGAARLAPALAAAGCRRFFVATLDEALALRAILPEAPLFVLHGLVDGEDETYAERRLAPVLNRPDEVARWADLCRTLGRRLPAALHVDTGMCRLGLDPADLEALEPQDVDACTLRLIMSHLACSEDTDQPANARQRARFEAVLATLPSAPASLANSSGIFLGEDYLYNVCRPGIALYGGNPTPGRPNPMRPVVGLHAPVLQVHEVYEPGSVGYGATYPTRRGSRIATVPVVYGDGLLRAAGNHAHARIAGREVPFAGRVSMDLITLDISALPRETVEVGTAVELIGGPDGIDALAAASGTIAYEVLTRLGPRFVRHYVVTAPEIEA